MLVVGLVDGVGNQEIMDFIDIGSRLMSSGSQLKAYSSSLTVHGSCLMAHGQQKRGKRTQTWGVRGPFFFTMSVWASTHYSCKVTQGQFWLSQCTLDLLGIRKCTLDVLIVLFSMKLTYLVKCNFGAMY